MRKCLAAGRRDWVHLRLCQSCGHVGCCDSSPGRHARFHFHTIGHPIVRSLEPGEDWLWCYADEVFIELEAPQRWGIGDKEALNDHGAAGGPRRRAAEGKGTVTVSD